MKLFQKNQRNLNQNTNEYKNAEINTNIQISFAQLETQCY